MLHIHGNNNTETNLCMLIMVRRFTNENKKITNFPKFISRIALKTAYIVGNKQLLNDPRSPLYQYGYWILTRTFTIT